MLNVLRLPLMMMTLKLFNESFALDFTVVVYNHLVKRRSCYCKEVPVLVLLLFSF